MRPIDFFVYYVSTLNSKRIKGSLYFDSVIERTVYLVGIAVSFYFLAIIEVVFGLFFHVDLAKNSFFTVIAAFITVMLVITLLKYIYIRKKRYKLITSSKFRAFSLSENIGLVICLILLLLSMIIAPFSAILIYRLLISN